MKKNFELSDSVIYKSEWDYYPESLILRDLDDELNLYHSSAGKSYNISHSDLKFDYEKNEKVLNKVSFGRKQTLHRVYACDICGRTKQKDTVCCGL